VIAERAVIVTGGSRGLGLALVRDLLENGYAVATCSRASTPALDELVRRYAADGGLFWSPCTLGDEPEETRYFRDVLAWCGGSRLYGLINNAGIAKEGILATFPNVESERIVQVNLMAALRMARLALQAMIVRPGPGRIINISSIIALRGYSGLAAYSVSKAGMDGLTRSLSREVGRREITVNSVNPGYLDTEMSSTLGENQREQILRRTPVGRLGTVQDVVPLVRFLLDDKASFITGQTIAVDGGITN
jgi:3-oxoacyl-[acyl-carrier protein] reductase